MTNSKLVDYTKLSPYHSGERKHPIDTITIHHMAGNLSVETCGNVFQSSKTSANYGVDTQGRVGLYVEEKNRAWTTASRDNDNRAVTIEVANDEIGGNWHVSDKALEKTIALCVDICRRNGIEKLNYTGDKSGNLTMHKWFAATNCPGPYLSGKFPDIAAEVNRQLAEGKQEEVLYRVQVGAFSKRENADAQLAKVKKAGFDAFIVRVDALYKIQVGAFKVYAYAEDMCENVKNAGFEAFITTKGGQSVSAAEAKKSVAVIAKEVIAGKWGDGAERKQRLTAAGYDYNEVQKAVNALMRGK